MLKQQFLFYFPCCSLDSFKFKSYVKYYLKQDIQISIPCVGISFIIIIIIIILFMIISTFFLQASERVNQNLSVLKSNAKLNNFQTMSSLASDIVNLGGPVQKNPLGF